MTLYFSICFPYEGYITLHAFIGKLASKDTLWEYYWVQDWNTYVFKLSFKLTLSTIEMAYSGIYKVEETLYNM